MRGGLYWDIATAIGVITYGLQGQSFAGSVTYNVGSFNATTTNSFGGASITGDYFTVPQWNPANFPGTELIQTDFTRTVSYSGNVTIYAGGDPFSNTDYSNFNPENVLTANGGTPEQSSEEYTTDTVYTVTDGTSEMGGVGFGPASPFFGEIYNSTSSPYGSLVGSGSLSWPATINIGIVGGPEGDQYNSETYSNQSFSEAGSITYYYQVPEPASAGLVVAGLSLMLGRRVKRA